MFENKIHNLVSHLAHKIHHTYMYPAQRHQIVWWLIEAVTKKSKLQLLTQNDEISATQRQQLHILLHEHAVNNKPLQYLIGSVPFCDATIAVEPPILIPRPETELWIAQCIEQLRPLKDIPLTILDMCTGSGCIAIALAQALPNAHIYAIDISHHALKLAQTNAHNNNVSNITFLHSDLFANIANKIQFDAILSNPPYITHTAWEQLEPSVKKWEDSRALVADNDGLDIIHTIITQAPSFLKPDSPLIAHAIAQLWIEIGYDQGKQVQQFMQDNAFMKVQIIKDLAHHDRVVIGSAFSSASVAHRQIQIHNR